MNKDTFCDVVEAESIARTLYTSAQEFTVINHGYDNIVVLVDKKYALRFARNDSARLRSKFEKYLLNYLEQNSSVNSPRVIREQREPYCLVVTFLFGTHLSPSKVRKFTLPQQIQFGKDVARFIYTLQKAVSTESVKKLRSELQLDEQSDEPWDVYVKNNIVNSKFASEAQSRISHDIYRQWKSVYNKGPLVVVHDDLHTENMLFVDSHLNGVIDYGDTTLGTAAQDLRQLYLINDLVTKSAISEYNRLSGDIVDFETVRIWAITHELTTYFKHLSKNQLDHPGFLRTSSNLNYWLPEIKWT